MAMMLGNIKTALVGYRILWMVVTFQSPRKARERNVSFGRLASITFLKAQLGSLLMWILHICVLPVECTKRSFHARLSFKRPLKFAFAAAAAAKTWRIVGNWLNSYHAWGSLGLMLMANWIETFLMLYVLPCLLRSKDEKSPATTKLALPEEETELNDAWNVPILFMTHVEGEG